MNCKLSDFIEINPKETLSKNALAKKVAMEKLYPYCREISGYEIEVYTGGSKFRNKDTIMARITPCLENGKIAQVNILDKNEVGFGSTEFIVLRAKKDIADPDYIYYLTISELVRIPAIKSMVGSSGRQRVQTDVVENLEIDLPDLGTQKKIAKILSALDDKIECNNQINKNLEEQAQLLYKSWFVDFEPFGGKIPNDWEQTDQKCTTDTIEKHIKGYLLQQGDIVVGMDGEFRPYLWGNTIAWLNQRVCVFRNKRPKGKAFLYYTLKPLLSKIEQTQIATTVIHIGKKEFDSFKITLPASDILDKFDEITEPMIDQIVLNKFDSETLSNIRDTLLPKLMSGELDVDKIEI